MSAAATALSCDDRPMVDHHGAIAAADRARSACGRSASHVLGRVDDEGAVVNAGHGVHTGDGNDDRARNDPGDVLDVTIVGHVVDAGYVADLLNRLGLDHGLHIRFGDRHVAVDATRFGRVGDPYEAEASDGCQ